MEEPPLSHKKVQHQKVVLKTSYQNIAIYAEDLIKWRKFELRPGIRIERDDYLVLSILFVARFVSRYHPSWDLSGFTLGLNRYYGRSLLVKISEWYLKLNNSTRQHQNFFILKSPLMQMN